MRDIRALRNLTPRGVPLACPANYVCSRPQPKETVRVDGECLKLPLALCAASTRNSETYNASSLVATCVACITRLA